MILRPYILPLQMGGIEGLTITGVFLLAYVAALITGFLLKKYLKKNNPEVRSQNPAELGRTVTGG